MRQFTLILYCCFILLPSVHRAWGLRCRTGNQQSDDQLQKVMQVCRRRFLGYDRDNGRDYYTRDTDSQESSSSDSDSDSDEDMFDNKFLSGGSFNRGYNRNSGSSSRSGTTMRQNRNWGSSGGRSGSYSMNLNSSRLNYGSGSSSGDYGQMNNRRNSRNNGGGMSNGYDNNYPNRNPYYNNNNNNYNNNMHRNHNNNNNNYDDNNNEGERERACVIQCFFSELNLVDQRGFPERSSVIGIMTQNIQDPELRDFVEESVVECYHYLNNNGRQEKCQFSQNLLSCIAEKGSERCEDWDDN